MQAASQCPTENSPIKVADADGRPASPQEVVNEQDPIEMMGRRRSSALELRAQEIEMRDACQVEKLVRHPGMTMSFGSPALSVTINDITMNDYLKAAHQGVNVSHLLSSDQ